jgi:predicted AAA+ superfamily ATPase
MLARNSIPHLREAMTDTSVILIHGARQCGKSTIARAAAPDAGYITLDDAAALAALTADPHGYLASISGQIVIDEVQRAPALFPAIKLEVDRRRTPGRFLLTGSANVLLVPRISESLAGRMEIITLRPFSQGEIEGRVETFIDRVFAEKWSSPAPVSARGTALVDRVIRGGFPEVVARESAERRGAWFAAYITSILERDVRDLANIEGLTDMPRLLSLLASRTSGLLNYADLSRTLSIPQTTVKRYANLLQLIFLVHLLPAWSSNRGLRLAKSPKVMLADTGLGCHLINAGRDRLLADGAAWGAMLENFLAMELLKQTGWSKTDASLFHFRTIAGQEADLVLEERGGRVVGIEIKASSTVGTSDFKGLRALAEAAGTRFVRGIVLYSGEHALPFGPNMYAVPISAIWGAE